MKAMKKLSFCKEIVLFVIIFNFSLPNLDFSIKAIHGKKNVYFELPFWIIKPEINSFLSISEASIFYCHSVYIINEFS